MVETTFGMDYSFALAYHWGVCPAAGLLPAARPLHCPPRQGGGGVAGRAASLTVRGCPPQVQAEEGGGG